MKIVIIGGHLAPALAVIDALTDADTVFFLGRKHVFEGDASLSLEYQEIQKRNILFEELKTGRLQRKVTRYTLPSLLKTPGAVIQATRILKPLKPDVVIGFGGYISVPVVVAASFLKIPIVLHEQTMEAGLANKILSRFATKICISWESSQAFFPVEKTVLTGNPIRMMTGKAENTESPPLLYITGGSGGSHVINMMVKSCIETLLETYRVYHQTGDARMYNDFEELEAMRNTFSDEKKSRYTLTKFIDPKDTGKIMQQATLVIGRSGINTVTELIIFEKPALLIPLPYTQRSEQEKNAQFLKKIGLAEILLQESASGDELLKMIMDMAKNSSLYKLNQKGLHKLHLTAGKHIIEVIHHVTKKKSIA